MKRVIYHITPRDTENGLEWAVKREKTERAAVIVSNKSDAIRIAKDILENHDLGQIKKSKRSLPELSVNRYLFADRLGVVITDILEAYTEKVFTDLLAKKKLAVAQFDSYPTTIALKSPAPYIFNKNLYERVDAVNGEESGFMKRIDLGALDNIEFWVRNREKIDPFYVQGWKKGKFYPDFVAVTKKENIIALEWKGEDRLDNPDTIYKTEIANQWAGLGRGKLHFFLVHNGNVEEVLNEVKKL